MTWHSFDESTPQDDQLIVVSSQDGTKQELWLWHFLSSREEIAALGFTWWLPLPAIPKPKDPFDEYWDREASNKLFSGTFPGTAKDAARIIYNAGRAYERSLK